MSARIEIVLDCADPDTLADFWAAALGYVRFGTAGNYRSIVPPEGDNRPKLILQGVPEAKATKNRLHIDIKAAEIEVEAARLMALGARRVEDRLVEEHGARWVVMNDPEGNEFCICQS